MSLSVIKLKQKAHWVWCRTLAIHSKAPQTRIASSLSPIEIFVTLYYGGVINFDSLNPYNEKRDRCIISKGHGSICMYPIFADLGFFSEKELLKVCMKGSFLGGIPDPVIPGYETVNGSLGHGLGVAAGIALGLKRKGNFEQNVFVISGDGELHEGSNWEAIMFAGHHQLDNLHLIVDDNEISMLDYTNKIVTVHPLKKRLISFGWSCVEVDGHDIKSLKKALLKQKKTKYKKPTALIAKTIKGRGVPGMQNCSNSHFMSLNEKSVADLLKEENGLQYD